MKKSKKDGSGEKGPGIALLLPVGYIVFTERAETLRLFWMAYGVIFLLVFFLKSEEQLVAQRKANCRK